jgi:hypothetical protein
MPKEDFVQNIDIGPGLTSYGGNYMGRTSGETTFSYSIETENLETEEDGVIDEIVINDPLTVTIPMYETDIDSLALAIPWAIKDSATGALHIGKAIGMRMAQHAKEVVIEPQQVFEGSKKLVIHKAYPKPGPVTFAYSKNGKRVANVQFVAIRDASKPAGKDYFDVVPMEPQVERVYATPAAGTYAEAQEVGLTTATAGATIYYTTDGSVPDENATEYTGEPISVTTPTLIRAIAIKEGFRDSEVSDFYYFGDLAE